MFSTTRKSGPKESNVTLNEVHLDGWSRYAGTPWYPLFVMVHLREGQMTFEFDIASVSYEELGKWHETHNRTRLSPQSFDKDVTRSIIYKIQKIRSTFLMS